MTNSLSLIIIEDSPEDFYAIKRILKGHEVTSSISHLDDGDKAIEYFKQLTSQEAEEIPGLILLDLNLPGTDGREVLQSLKSHPTTRMIPVVITTTSSNPRDVDYCYEQGANGYFVKPVDFKHLQHSLITIVDYWFAIVLPPYTSTRLL